MVSCNLLQYSFKKKHRLLLLDGRFKVFTNAYVVVLHRPEYVQCSSQTCALHSNCMVSNEVLNQKSK